MYYTYTRVYISFLSPVSCGGGAGCCRRSSACIDPRATRSGAHLILPRATSSVRSFSEGLWERGEILFALVWESWHEGGESEGGTKSESDDVKN